MVLSASEFLTKTSVVMKFCLLIMLTDVNSRPQTTFTQILNSIYFPHNEGGKIIFNTDNWSFPFDCGDYDTSSEFRKIFATAVRWSFLKI